MALQQCEREAQHHETELLSSYLPFFPATRLHRMQPSSSVTRGPTCLMPLTLHFNRGSLRSAQRRCLTDRSRDTQSTTTVIALDVPNSDRRPWRKTRSKHAKFAQAGSRFFDNRSLIDRDKSECSHLHDMPQQPYFGSIGPSSPSGSRRIHRIKSPRTALSLLRRSAA